MFRRLRNTGIGWLAGLLATCTCLAQEPSLPFAVPEPSSDEPAPVHQWLEEVRAQRLAREARRHANKEAIKARRRLIDPWGAAQKELRDQENQRRRDAFMDHIERDREAFRNQAPWVLQQPIWQGEAAQPPSPESPPASIPQGPPANSPQGSSASIGADWATGKGVAATSSDQLPGWDNRWYYRGF